MTLKSFLMGGFAALAFSASAHAEITIEDPYVRSSGATAKVGAAFFTIANSGTSEDRLVSVATDASKIAELHTHLEGDNGVMMMREDTDGFAVEAGGAHALERGGDHVMLMGLTAPLVQGEAIELTLTFEHAGEVTVTVPVDHDKAPGHTDAAHSHDEHSHAEDSHAEQDHDADEHKAHSH